MEDFIEQNALFSSHFKTCHSIRRDFVPARKKKHPKDACAIGKPRCRLSDGCTNQSIEFELQKGQT